MNGDPTLNDLARKAKRSRRVPPGAVCGACGGTEHLVAKASGMVRCYQHRDPKIWYERDHLAGRANIDGLTVSLQPNAHRTVTEMRTTLGQDDWPPANGNGLLGVAHAIAGWATLLWLIARWLVDLAQWLRKVLGANWSDKAPPSPLGR